MSVSDAKKYKESLSVLLICKPYIEDDALTFTSSCHNKPTFDSPIEINDSVLSINVELIEVWIYDFKTGKILYKQNYL